MRHVFLNGVGASAGAGLTYLYNVIPRLSSEFRVQTTVALQPQLRREFNRFPNVKVLDADVPAGIVRRFWFEQRKLPRLIRASGAHILVSLGNFALRKSPVPQILLSGNSLYTSADFDVDLRRRREARMWLDTKLKATFARRSVDWADCTVAPSHAFAGELNRWTGQPIMAIHHGFDPGTFFAEKATLPESITQKLNVSANCIKLLFVSHYNYYRNFETLFRAVAVLRKHCPDRPIRLFLTCTLQDHKTPGAYKTERARQEIDHLGIRREVIELGAIPYRLLHSIYRACDLYVTAAYAETFAHPLVEAMASGLPIVASDIEVHREVCGDEALYFPRFSAESLADQVLTSLNRVRPSPREDVLRRFSWTRHLEEVLAIADRLLERPKTLGQAA
jgi:glycosyltransferase involved in cell wall biosynthesis